MNMFVLNIQPKYFQQDKKSYLAVYQEEVFFYFLKEKFGKCGPRTTQLLNPNSIGMFCNLILLKWWGSLNLSPLFLHIYQFQFDFVLKLMYLSCLKHRKKNIILALQFSLSNSPPPPLQLGLMERSITCVVDRPLYLPSCLDQENQFQSLVSRVTDPDSY